MFSIDRDGLTRQQLFQLATQGFRVWEFGASPEMKTLAGGSDVPFPMHISTAASLLATEAQPERISDLTGYVIRVYKNGDLLTEDYRLDRVNIETDPNTHRIVRYWFG